MIGQREIGNNQLTRGSPKKWAMIATTTARTNQKIIRLLPLGMSTSEKPKKCSGGGGPTGGLRAVQVRMRRMRPWKRWAWEDEGLGETSLEEAKMVVRMVMIAQALATAHKRRIGRFGRGK